MVLKSKISIKKFNFATKTERMKRKLLSGLLLSCCFGTILSSDFNQKDLDSLNRIIQQAAAEQNVTAESHARIDRICFFYNYDLNDSLLLYADEDMKFNRLHGLWDNYFETWMHKANDLVFCGKVNTGLRELKLMHDEALKANHRYGLFLTYYGMGNAYISMEHYDEAEENYAKALEYFSNDTVISHTMILDLYSYYCDALNMKQSYDRMLEVLSHWKQSLEHIQKDNGNSSSRVWYGYYYLACAQAHTGLGHYTEAKAALDEVAARSGTDGDFLFMSHLFYLAQLYLKTGNPKSALQLNSKRIQMSEDINDVSSPVMIYRQRADILMAMGNYREAANAYLKMYQKKDSLDNRQMRDQTQELTTLYRVEELAREQEMAEQRLTEAKRLERTRIAMVITVLISLSMIIFIIYGYITSQRLRRKNEELVVAHKKAQESSLMKTKFIQNMSHEIRTPLNILSGFSQILAQADDSFPAEIKKEASEKIMENTHRITTIINELLALSESDSRTEIERNDTVSVLQLCAQAIMESGVEENPDYRFSFSSRISDDEMVKTSGDYVVQSLVRLLDNAMKFSPKQRDIRLDCSRNAEKYFISIENDVITPIDKADAERIFDPFVQLDEFNDGVGVGLSVSRNVLRRLGGDVRLDTSYLAGARFVVELPCA